MSVSTFEKLLAPDFSCAEFFMQPTGSGGSGWSDAKEEAESFRKYLDTLVAVPTEQKVNSYLITQKDIMLLLAQDNGLVNGIRVYIGKEEVQGGWVIKLYAVACKYNTATRKYDDFQLDIFPQLTTEEEIKAALPILSEVRPCPDNCGKPNFMNP